MYQGLMQQRQYERTPEQEKIEKRRQVSFGSNSCDLNNDNDNNSVVLLFIRAACFLVEWGGVGWGMRLGC